MSDLLNFDYLDQQRTLDNMTDNIFANEWMPSWEEKSAAANTYNHYTQARQLTDDEMFEFCMSGIANVEDFLRSKPEPMFTSNNGFDADGGQDAAVATNGIGTDADDVLAAITSYNSGAVYDAPIQTSATREGWINEEYGEVDYKEASLFDNASATYTPAPGLISATGGPTGDSEPEHLYDTSPSTKGGDAGYGYAPAAAVDPFTSDFNPLLYDVFASMNAQARQGGVENIAPLNTSSSNTAAPDNVADTSASSELVAAEAATVTQPGVKPQVLVDSENAPQAALLSEDDLFANLGDFPEFPELDDVAISPTTLSHKTKAPTSHVTASAADHVATAKAPSTSSSDVKTPVHAHDNIFIDSAVDHHTGQDNKLGRSPTASGTPPTEAPNFVNPDTVGSTSATSAATTTSPKVSAPSSNTSPASTKSASLSSKYVSPFVSDEDDIFPPMESFEEFLSSPASNAAAATAPTPKPVHQNVVDLTADTPVTAHFPAMGQTYYNAQMPAQPAYSSRMPTQPSYMPTMPAQSAYSSRTPVQPAYTPAMPTQQYQFASPYLNSTPATPYQPQKPIWEMSDAELASWLGTAGVPPTPAPAPASTMPGLESPHYASTELPQAPYTSPMPRKRKASSVLPAQTPKKARAESSRPIAQPWRRQPANGIPNNYSWLNSTAAPTARPTNFTAPAAAVPAPPSALGSDPAPLLAFTISGQVRGCTRVSDEQWAKMYDSAVVNGGKIKMKRGRWARLWITGRVKEVDGVQRGVVAVVME